MNKFGELLEQLGSIIVHLCFLPCLLLKTPDDANRSELTAYFFIKAVAQTAYIALWMYGGRYLFGDAGIGIYPILFIVFVFFVGLIS